MYTLIKSGILVSKDHNSVEKDILIRDKKILEIDDFIDEKEGWKLINASGKIVAPGFISIHSHNDFYFPIRGHSKFIKSLLFQGITTSVCGNCGISNYPIIKGEEKNLDSYQGFLHIRKPDYRWESLGEYLDYIKGKIIINFIPLVGHGTLRVISNGFNKDLTSKSKKKIKSMLIDCLDQGCFGMSSGLMYMPGTFSKTEELIELIKIIKKYPNTIYSSHLRGYSDTYLESVNEAIRIGRESGINVQCSHLGPFGIKFGPKIKEVLELLENANDNGIKIGYDTLAYCGGSTTIMALLPPWSYKSGLKKFLLDIKDKDFYEEIINYVENYIPKWPSWEGTGWTDNFIRSLGWKNLYVLGAKNDNFVGKNFIQIGKENSINKYEAMRKVLIEENGRAIMYMAGVGSCIDDEGDMSYFDRMIEKKMGLITVDAIYSSDGRTMPYAYGTFPRIIDRYVKIKRTITLKEAIEKFTSNVAEKINMKVRGYLRPGAYADIVIFDFDNIKDHPDIFAKKPKLASGIEYLLINGELIIDGGNFKEVLVGEVIINR